LGPWQLWEWDSAGLGPLRLSQEYSVDPPSVSCLLAFRTDFWAFLPSAHSDLLTQGGTSCFC
jgi:hypothetical protein